MITSPMGDQLLTPELHQLLIRKGYKYLLLKDVFPKNNETAISCYLLNAVKDMPKILQESCTGIEDGMICSIVNGETAHIEILVAY